MAYPRPRPAITRVARLFVPAVVALSAACDATGPAADGPLTAEVVSPNGDEGAAVVELVGSVGSIAGPEGSRALTASSGDTTWVVVILEIPGPIALSVTRGPDAAALRGRVLQVADGANRLRDDLGGYAVRVRR